MTFYDFFDLSTENLDIIIRFENLQKDLTNLIDRLKFKYPEVKEIPHLNKTNRVKDYRIYYSQEMADIVAKRCKQDIEYFGYDF